MFKLLIVITLSLRASFGFGQTVEQQFTARSITALDRIEKLVIKNGDSRGKNLTPQEHCQWKLENIYLSFGHPELSKIAIIPLYTELLGKEAKAYRFVLMDENGSMGFQLNYVYAGKNDSSPLMAEIHKIAEDWSIKLIQDSPKDIVVRSPLCTFWFKQDDPFESKVEAN